MAEMCERCDERPVVHRAVRLRISDEKEGDVASIRDTKLRGGPLDLCQGCFDDLITKATLAWEGFRRPQ